MCCCAAVVLAAGLTGCIKAWQRAASNYTQAAHIITDALLLLQYVGSVLSIWGGVILAFHQSPPGLVALATYWSLLYLITGCVEQFL